MRIKTTRSTTGSVTAMSGEALLLLAIRNAKNTGVRNQINCELSRRASEAQSRSWLEPGPIARIGRLACS